MSAPRYGMAGWREFASNRIEILAKFDAAKARAASRPVKTEHGETGEAAFREWLDSFLPRKYGVTSGFIIPDIVQTPEYKLYHYDVVVFDALNAPVLWTEGNPDQSQQGRSRAIPARHVHSVMEVKSTFTARAAQDGIGKLRELSGLSPYLPPHFTSHLVFMDLSPALTSHGHLLKHVLPHPKLTAFRGGVILRCVLNQDMSGVLGTHTNDGGPGSVNNNRSLPLAKDVDTLNIYMNQNGQCVIAEDAGAAMFVADGNSNWMVSKIYAPTFCEGHECVFVHWSANGFATFALSLLSYLEGKAITDPKYTFGQVFDPLERRT